MVSGLIVLHVLQPSGVRDELVKIQPTTGTKFATVLLGEECAIAEQFDISGTLFVEDDENGLAAIDPLHTFVQAPLTELWVLNKNAEHLQTKFDGRLDAVLTGSHSNTDWSGEAG